MTMSCTYVRQTCCCLLMLCCNKTRVNLYIYIYGIHSTVILVYCDMSHFRLFRFGFISTICNKTKRNKLCPKIGKKFARRRQLLLSRTDVNINSNMPTFTRPVEPTKVQHCIQWHQNLNSSFQDIGNVLLASKVSVNYCN